MLTTLMRRLRREEDGYSLVIAMLLLAIMSVLLVVSLQVGNSSLSESSLGIEWSKTLTVAEGGVNDAITRLGESRSAANPCPIGSTTLPPCTAEQGQYQLSWAQSGKSIIIKAIGYYPTKSAAKFTRGVQVTYQPVPAFQYAIFSKTAVDIKNGATVVGDVYSDGNITVGTGATVCGSVTSSAGGVTLSNGSQVVTDWSTYGCSGKSGLVWTGGSGGIVGASTVTIWGDAKASAPSTVTCSPLLSTNGVSNASGGTGFTIKGSVTACGSISGVGGATSQNAGSASATPVPVTFPQFVFDPNNYSSDASDSLHLQCYPSVGTCGSNDSTTAISDFNAYVATHKTNLTGTFAVWQRSPVPMSSGICSTASTTQICLDGISLSGDFTLITNAPVDFGNTSTVATTSTSIAADMSVISTYQPAASTTCDTNGGDCSIYGNNSIVFDSGSLTDPNDGVVGLLYTTGKMAFNNSPHSGNPGEGALYASSMNFKNNYDIAYNSRIERVLGFGTTYEQTLWQELNV
jgi:hypothetical protein